LGYLIATWEHRVFITATMLEINPFDQFGVIAGKKFVREFFKDG
jgi:glucose-6-phosphate isomerase